MENRKCPECGFEIIGRSDKKYCSDQCRSLFNNRQNKTINREVNRINSILKTNRKILRECHLSGSQEFLMKRLKKKGFDFNYYTHIVKNKKAVKQYFCYEFGYFKIGKKAIAVFKTDSNEGLQ